MRLGNQQVKQQASGELSGEVDIYPATQGDAVCVLDYSATDPVLITQACAVIKK